MTIKEIENDIRSGKCTAIYYSSGSLWWTHLESDLIDSTKKGINYQKVMKEKMLQDPSITDEHKKKFQSLFNIATSTVPLDPIGNVICKMTNPKKWMVMSLLNPKHYGACGLRAFIYTHHQNCTTFFSNNWNAYNNHLKSKDNGNLHAKTIQSKEEKS
jgi:hypothetical protein